MSAGDGDTADSEGTTDAEAIIALAEQSAATVEAMPGAQPGREDYAAAVLRGFIAAARALLRERAEARARGA